MSHTLEASQRRALTTRAIKEQRTLMERWDTDEVKRFPGWEERARKVRYLLKRGDAVADVGCGAMTLERHLPKGCSYVPVDVVRRDDRTVVVDLNRERLPDLNATVIVALGLVEYLFDPKSFFQRCHETSPRLIFSYHPVDMNYGHDRLADYWVNSLTVMDIMSQCFDCQYSSVTVLPSLKNELLFLAKRPEKPTL